MRRRLSCHTKIILNGDRIIWMEIVSFRDRINGAMDKANDKVLCEVKTFQQAQPGQLAIRPKVPANIG